MTGATQDAAIAFQYSHGDRYWVWVPDCSRWDRYLGMTAAMTQVPVPTATSGRSASDARTAPDGQETISKDWCR